MEDQSKHPLEIGVAPPTTQKSRFNLWFVLGILFALAGFGLDSRQFAGVRQPALIMACLFIVAGTGQFLRFTPKKNPGEMKQLSDFELAQMRLETRQNKRTFAFLWLGIFGVLLLTNILFGNEVAGLLIPLMLLTLVMSAYYGLHTYYSNPQKILNTPLIEKEMVWLFGNDWQVNTGRFEYTFAQDRIRARRRDRWIFVLHLLVYLPVTGFALYGAFDFAAKYQEITIRSLCLSVPLLWTVFLLLPHGFKCFPTEGILARRERKVGENLQSEMDNMYPSKVKNDEKSKRDVEYRVGDDGELEEV